MKERIIVVIICSERGDLDRLFTEKRVGVYVGVDPTAPSMHVGHLLPLMVLYWMYFHGFHVCSLVSNLSSYSTRVVIDACSLEGQRHKLGTPSDEQLLAKNSLARHESLTCSRSTCS